MMLNSEFPLEMLLRHMTLSIDDRPVVTPSMAYEEKGGKLNVKEQ